jgi:hypothetical protein
MPYPSPLPWTPPTAVISILRKKTAFRKVAEPIRRFALLIQLRRSYQMHRSPPQLRNPHVCLGHDYESIGQFISQDIEEALERFDLIWARLVVEAEQNNASVGPVQSEDFLAEIFVVRYQDPVLSIGLLQDLVILRPAVLFEDGINFVALLTKPPNDGGSGAFIHQEAHVIYFPRQGA